MSRVGAHLLGAGLAAGGALLEHHFERDQEQHDPAGDAEGGEADAERAEQALAEQGEEDQDEGGDSGRAERHRPAVGGREVAGQAGEDRRAAGRIDDDEEGDGGRDEQLDHSPSGASRPKRAQAATRVLRSSTAIVIGPTPPGTGVIAPATWAAVANS